MCVNILNGIPAAAANSGSIRKQAWVRQAGILLLERFLFVCVVQSMIMFAVIPAVLKQGGNFPAARDLET
jgi:hypothetical protein